MRVWSTTFKCLLHLLFLFVYLVCNVCPASAQDEDGKKPSTESPKSEVKPAAEPAVKPVVEPAFEPAAKPAVERSEDKLADVITVAQLILELRKLDKFRSRKLEEMLQNSKRRIDLAKVIISRTEKAEYKQEASLILIKAAKSAYGVNYFARVKSPTADQEFEESYSQFIDSSDDKILREAHFSKLVHSMFQGMKGNEEAERVLDAMHVILSRFEGESSIEDKVEMLFKSCIETNAEFAKQLGDEFYEGNLAEEQKSEFLQEIFDRHLAY